MLNVERIGPRLLPNPSRVLLRSFSPVGEAQNLHIVARISMLSDREVSTEVAKILGHFESRHRRLKEQLLHRFKAVRPALVTDENVNAARKTLFGAYFSQEYAVEGAALFNPSMVWHPDQTGLPEGSQRFVLSLRATGEGHLSSIEFRVGTVDRENNVALDAPTTYLAAPERTSFPCFDRTLFEKKLRELDHWDDLVESILATLEPQFTMEQLTAACALFERQRQYRKLNAAVPLQSVMTLARANYEVFFAPTSPLSERILFPTSPTEINGMEDARFVQFVEDDGKATYYATYTAYDGKVIMPQILKTTDFQHFEMNTLNGPEIQNKGMALFPRKVHGRYAMLSRQDNENIYIMFSDNLYFWYAKEILLKPTFPWEYFQLGNCGSPLETKDGWLVLTHGVGAMRQYAIGAVLLDLDNPSCVIGRLREPLIVATDEEREGYVPNVVYSCGSQIHDGVLILPYATSDSAVDFARVSVADLLAQMVRAESR